MHRPQAQVRDFHRLIGVPMSSHIVDPQFRNPELRAKLILEEAFETAEALVGTTTAYRIISDYATSAMTHYKAPNLLDAIDGLCDTIVVCYGTAEDISVDLEPFYDEVHAANMRKGDGPVRADGKRQKPPGWVGPDHAKVMREYLSGRRK